MSCLLHSNIICKKKLGLAKISFYIPLHSSIIIDDVVAVVPFVAVVVIIFCGPVHILLNFARFVVWSSNNYDFILFKSI